jgi:hypothetical protein
MHASADDEYVNPPSDTGHEHTDASVRLIVRFAIWLAASAIGVHVLMWLMFGFFYEQRLERQTVEFPLAVGQGRRLPPEPRLQADPESELYRFRLQEDVRLRSYGWVDQNEGIVHIPITEAMRLTVERGLPSRPGAEAEETEPPGSMPSDASAGRVMERRRQ